MKKRILLIINIKSMLCRNFPEFYHQKSFVWCLLVWEEEPSTFVHHKHLSVCLFFFYPSHFRPKYFSTLQIRNFNEAERLWTLTFVLLYSAPELTSTHTYYVHNSFTERAAISLSLFCGPDLGKEYKYYDNNLNNPSRWHLPHGALFCSCICGVIDGYGTRARSIGTFVCMWPFA